MVGFHGDFKKYSASGKGSGLLSATMHARLRYALPAAVALLAIALLLVVVLDGPSGGSSSRGSPSSAGDPSGFDGAALPPGAPAYDFTLTDQRGRRVSLSSSRGRVTILTFLYSSCPRACVVIAQQIRGALEELGPGVAAVAVSVDPAADSPAAVHGFLERVSLDGRLEYLSGSPAQLAPVWHAYGVVPASAGEAAYARSAPVLLLDREGRARVLFQLEQLTPESLAHDARKLETG